MTGKSILIIDDQPETAEALHRTLVAWGHAAAIVADASEGLDWYWKHRPSLVMVYTEMVGADTVIADIRASAPNTLIVAMADQAGIARCMRLYKDSADEFLARPVDETVLEITLRRALRSITLLNEIKNVCSRDRDASTCENVAREVANERFLVVRQIVEKMSTFIAQVATGVEGGVKYFNELPYFLSVHSPDCRILAASPSYLNYFGNRIHKNSWGIYVGKRATRQGCPVGQTLRNATVETTGALVRYASGARVPVLVHTAPIYDNNGEVALVLEVFTGTQELDKLAQQILSTQQRYAQLFDAVPLQIAVLDRHLNITANNAKFKEAFGDQTGGKFFQIFRPAVFPAHRDPISMTLRDGQPHQGKMIMAGPDHRQYTMLAQTSPIMTVNGKMIQIMVIFKDITEIRQLKDNLASLGLMLGAVCHDMKGCLTGLDAGIYMIDKGFYRNVPGRIEEGLELIRLMKDRIHKLIFSVLYSAKERSLELESVDMHGFAGDLVVAVNNRIRGADIEFNYTVAEDAGYMEMDPGLMRSALINILDNAVDACLEGSRRAKHRIDFQVHALSGEVVFEIGDTGKGIPKEELRNIFNVFYSSKKQKGTGLGLYITGNVIKKHGGTIDIDSVVGEGTTFFIRLPRHQEGYTLTGD